MKRVAVLITVVMLGLVLTTGAFASSVSSGHGSTPNASAVLGTKAATSSPATTVTAKTLPFTGLGLGAFALAGVVLVGLGLALRTTSRRTS